MQVLLKIYDQVMIMDNTHNVLDHTNKSCKIFFLIIINENGQAEIISYFFTINETLSMLFPIYGFLSK